MVYMIDNAANGFYKANDATRLWKELIGLLESGARRDQFDIIFPCASGGAVANIHQFAFLMGEPLPKEKERVQLSKDDCYVLLTIYGQDGGSSDPVAQPYIVPLTKEEAKRLQENGKPTIKEFVLDRVHKAMQSAKYWEEIVASDFTFTWSDALSSEVLDAAMGTLTPKDIPADIIEGERGTGFCKDLMVYDCELLAPTKVPVLLAGYRNTIRVLQVETVLDMQTGEIGKGTPLSVYRAGIDTAKVFFADGTSVECDPDANFLKLKTDSYSIYYEPHFVRYAKSKNKKEK